MGVRLPLLRLRAATDIEFYAPVNETRGVRTVSCVTDSRIAKSPMEKQGLTFRALALRQSKSFVRSFYNPFSHSTSYFFALLFTCSFFLPFVHRPSFVSLSPRHHCISFKTAHSYFITLTHLPVKLQAKLQLILLFRSCLASAPHL